MPLNDMNLDEFEPELEDEWQFDAHPPPGVEIGRMRIQPDYGSGSYAKDGRLEVAEDTVMNNGEAQVGSAAMYGPTEIGEGLASEDGQSEIGGPYAQDGAAEIGAGLYPEDGASELGHHGDIMKPFESFMLDDVRMGYDKNVRNDFGIDAVGAAAAADRPGSEIGGGPYAQDGAAEIGAGLFPADGASEIGGPYAQDGAAEIGAGLYPEDGASELGYAADVMPDTDIDPDLYHAPSGYEIGAREAVARVVQKARDNRAPAPPMKVVPVDAPDEMEDWPLADVVIGAAVKTGVDLFPLTTKLLQRAGAGMAPRIVRVDTEESYKQFRTESSPELSELRAKLERHMSDPFAHDLPDGLQDDVDDLVHLGAEAKAAEDEKRVEMWMPKRFDGKVEAWLVDDFFIGASVALPGHDGTVRICTSLEPIRKSVAEMSQHAAEAGVPAATVVGVLPAMGCVLGAGTAVKEMAAAAPAILARPESVLPEPFMVRIEPKVSPAIGALAMLIMECRRGNQQACSEWARLGAVSPPVIKQAMQEALQIVKAAVK